MMGEMLDLVEIARIDEDETEQPPEYLVEPLGPEHGRMAELVLACVKEIDQRSVDNEDRNGKPASPRERKRDARQRERGKMAPKSKEAQEIRLGAERLQPQWSDHVAASKNFVHRLISSFRQALRAGAACVRSARWW